MPTSPGPSGRGATPLVRLVATPGLPGVDPRQAGLFHTAFPFETPAALAATVARQMMRSLTASGHDDLVANAVVLLHELEAPTDSDQHHREVMGTVAAEFEGRVSAIIPIPFDTALKDGDTIEYANLSPATRGAYQEAAAAIATSMRTQLTKDGSK